MKATGNEYINQWLKYHDTTIEEVIKEHPEWQENSREFYQAYPVTQEQHDEWYEWAIQTVMKEYRMGRKRAKKEFCFPYLDLAPNVKEK